MNEQRLIKRIASQDEAALEELYGLYHQRLGAFLLSMTRDTQLVGEIINDVFLVVWQKAAGFRGDSQPSTWIMGIAHNKALHALRTNRRALPALPLDYASDGAQVANLEEEASDVYESLQRLAPIHRAVIVLTYQFGYNYREIAELLGCPEGTVKTRMYHARRKLQVLLEAS